MPDMGKLITLLPILALLGLTLTAIEDVPLTLAHRPAIRSSNEHHRHLAARQRVASNIEKRAFDNRLVRRSADGSMCRARGQSGSFSSTTASASTTSSSSTVPTSSSTEADVVAVQVTVSTTSSANNEANYAQATTTSTTSSTAAAASTSAASVSVSVTLGSGGWTNTNSKFGAGWPNGDYASSSDPNYIGNYIGSKTAWYYTWTPYCVSSADKLGIEYVPMLWGPNQVSDWWAQMGSWPSTVKNALFFNEPNDSGQSNIAAGDAVQYWMNDFLPLRSKGVRLGGAATTSADTGLEWIQAFSAACTNDGNSAADCKMDFVPLHYYSYVVYIDQNYYTDVQNFQDYVSNFHTQTGLNVWVTEYACESYVSGTAQCSESETWAMHQQMAAWFDEQDYVERYAPFGMMENLQGVNQYNALMDTSGSITSLGSWYIGSS